MRFINQLIYHHFIFILSYI